MYYLYKNVKDYFLLNKVLKYIFCFSCVIWSSYYKNVLVSLDYEGIIILWDVFIGQKFKFFQVLYIKFKIYI